MSYSLVWFVKALRSHLLECSHIKFVRYVLVTKSWECVVCPFPGILNLALSGDEKDLVRGHGKFDINTPVLLEHRFIQGHLFNIGVWVIQKWDFEGCMLKITQRDGSYTLQELIVCTKEVCVHCLSNNMDCSSWYEHSNPLFQCHGAGYLWKELFKQLHLV